MTYPFLEDLISFTSSVYWSRKLWWCPKISLCMYVAVSHQLF